MKRKKKFNLTFLVFCLILVLAACSSQNKAGSNTTDKAPVAKDKSTEEVTKDNVSDPASIDSESNGKNAQTKPLADMTLDDLTEYFKKVNLIKENSETSKLCCIGSDTINYKDVGVEVYWYDLKNMNETLQKEYEGAKKDGYVTLGNSQVLVQVHGPFAVNASASTKAEEFVNAVKELK
ncbi:hypothetical protein CHH57_12090 [Niallia circulans]|uniref:Uncharacterized protein n=1 Tax=Niallia circulans TaxID=1397 RepID=A0AA91Z0G9_NIACI|nr:hypothetical protein [Niallia circulans]PAD82927.1 hypothetical protein CHH57_12090 [Niallia circulans]